MGILTDDMKRVVLEQRLGFAATVCPDGSPNLSPKGTTTVWDDDHLVFADLRSPGTIRNLERNPAIEINVVDPIARKGYRFKGTATVHRGDATFDRFLEWYGGEDEERRRDVAGRTRAVVLIRVERALPLTSPAYDEGLGEDEVVERWEAHYDELRRARART